MSVGGKFLIKMKKKRYKSVLMEFSFFAGQSHPSWHDSWPNKFFFKQKSSINLDELSRFLKIKMNEMLNFG